MIDDGRVAGCEQIVAAAPIADPTKGVKYLAPDGGGRKQGTELDDNLLGGTGADQIFGLDGNDIIWGKYQAGRASIAHDLLDGGPGDDTIYGGPGDDAHPRRPGRRQDHRRHRAQHDLRRRRARRHPPARPQGQCRQRRAGQRRHPGGRRARQPDLVRARGATRSSPTAATGSRATASTSSGGHEAAADRRGGAARAARAGRGRALRRRRRHDRRADRLLAPRRGGLVDRAARRGHGHGLVGRVGDARRARALRDDADTGLWTWGNGGVSLGSSWAAAGDLTLEAWIYPSSSSGTRYVISKGTSATGFQLMYSGSTRRASFSVGATGGTATVTAGQALALGTWHHLAATLQGSTLTLYVDGQQAATAVASGTVRRSAALALVAGRPSWTSSSGLYGALDEVAIYDRALSGAEIAAHVDAGIDRTAPDVADRRPARADRRDERELRAELGQGAGHLHVLARQRRLHRVHRARLHLPVERRAHACASSPPTAGGSPRRRRPTLDRRLQGRPRLHARSAEHVDRARASPR